MESKLSWEETKRYLEERGHILSESDFQWLLYMTMSRIMTNIDDGDYQRVSIATADGTGWNFRIKKEK